ncbi:MAG: DUF4346 domain-containing protein, partial [Nanoarchaeota archaeon]
EVGIVQNYTMVRTYSGTNARDLYKTIVDAKEISRQDHAAYLGYELARAEQALRGKTRYVQG